MAVSRQLRRYFSHICDGVYIFRWSVATSHSIRLVETVCYMLWEDRVTQSVEHWTANLAARVRSPVGEVPSDLMCAFLHVQMESNWAGLLVVTAGVTTNNDPRRIMNELFYVEK